MKNSILENVTSMFLIFTPIVTHAKIAAIGSNDQEVKSTNVKPRQQNRRAWIKDLKSLKRDYLLQTKENAKFDAASFNAIEKDILNQKLPYDVRVKYTLMLGRICRKYPEMNAHCRQTMLKLDRSQNADPKQKKLSAYLDQKAHNPPNTEFHRELPVEGVAPDVVTQKALVEDNSKIVTPTIKENQEVVESIGVKRMSLTPELSPKSDF